MSISGDSSLRSFWKKAVKRVVVDVVFKYWFIGFVCHFYNRNVY